MSAKSATLEVQRHELIRRAVAMRERGLSYRTIGKQLSVDVKTAYRYVWTHFDELDTEAAETLDKVRSLELVRLDRYLKRLEKAIPGAEDGGVKAILAAVKVGERRAKLLGLDAPAKVEHRELPSEYLEQTPEQRIAAHEAAIAEERAKLAGGMH